MDGQLTDPPAPRPMFGGRLDRVRSPTGVGKLTAGGGAAPRPIHVRGAAPRDDLRVAAEDLTTICPSCGARMDPEHAHYRCRMCEYRDTCCDGAPAQPG